MNIDQSMAEPTADESVPGGSYIPKESSPFKLDLGAGMDQYLPEGQTKNFLQQLGSSTKGRASHINDFDLTMSGIVDGDPVGMETFDLGYFKDGTPSITINGAHVPIRADQWMALLSMREKTRTEIKQRAEFESAKSKAKSSVSKVIRAFPSLPSGMAELFMAQADIDPVSALNNLQSLYMDMQTGRGKDKMSDMHAQLTAAKRDPAMAALTSKRGKKTVYQTATDSKGNQVQYNPQEVDVPSVAEEQSNRYANAASPSEETRATANAFLHIKSMFIDPNIRKARAGQQYGIFDRITMDESDPVGPMSIFEMLRNLAKNGEGAFPTQIGMVPPPVFIGDRKKGVGSFQPTDPRAVKAYRDYLIDLDRWAANAFPGYDLSSPQSIDAMMQLTFMNNLRDDPALAGQIQEQGSNQQSPVPTAPPAPAAPASSRPLQPI